MLDGRWRRALVALAVLFVLYYAWTSRYEVIRCGSHGCQLLDRWTGGVRFAPERR